MKIQLVGSTKLANQFFAYQNKTEVQKALLATSHLEEDAVQWFQWYELTQPILTWNLLVKAACIRFKHTEQEGFHEAFSQVRQNKYVRKYQTGLDEGRKLLWAALLED